MKPSSYLTPEQIKMFIIAVKDTEYAIPSLLALNSLRPSEIQALDWADISEDTEFIHVRRPKSFLCDGDVPILIPELRESLQQARKASGPVMECSQEGLRRGLKTICKACGLPYVAICGLRSSFFLSLAPYLGISERDAMIIEGTLPGKLS
jgi:integrase